MKFILRSINEYKTNINMTLEKWFNAVYEDDLDLIKEYLENGFNINSKNKENETMLILSVRDGKIEIVMELLKHSDLDINIRDSNNETVLIKSCKFSDLILVQNLLNFPNIDINSYDFHKNTALIWACFNDKIQIVKELLKRNNINISINLKDSDKNSALDYAKRHKNQEMIDLLKEAGAK